MFSLITAFFAKNRYIVIVTLAVVILGIILWQQHKTIKRQEVVIAVAAHNLAAANDTIRVTKDKNGQIEYNKLAFLVNSLDELKKSNADLYSEVKAIKGDVAVIQKVGVKVVHDTIPLIVKAEIVDSTITADFAYDTSYSPGNSRKIEGYTKYDLRNGNSSGKITTDDISLSLVTGVKNLDINKPEIFIKTDYPGITFTSIEGAVIDKNLFKDKKQPLLSASLNLGWVPVTYDWRKKEFNGNATRLGANIGIGINLVRLFKK